MEARILLRRWSGRHASVPGCQEQDDAYARCDTAEGDVLLQFLVGIVFGYFPGAKGRTP